MIIKTSLTLLISSLLFAGCCTGSNISTKSDSIPEALERSSDKFIVAKTGKNFFNKYIKPDYEKITKIKNGYLMVYNFSMPDKEGIEGEIRFIIDSTGNIQKDKEITGIPDCLSEQCDFKISKDEAENIAQKAGLNKGVKDWEINFVWNAEFEKYIWQIRITLSESKGSEFNRSSGQVMLIDPNDGAIIKTKEWRVN
jgi:hypothetical protein